MQALSEHTSNLTNWRFWINSREDRVAEGLERLTTKYRLLGCYVLPRPNSCGNEYSLSGPNLRFSA